MQEFFDSNQQGYGKYFQIGLKIRFLKCREREEVLIPWMCLLLLIFVINPLQEIHPFLPYKNLHRIFYTTSPFLFFSILPLHNFLFNPIVGFINITVHF